MPKIRSRKHAEDLFFDSHRSVKSHFSKLGSAFAKFFEFGSKKLTVMVVPHSQKKVINFQTTPFAIFGALVAIAGMASFFVWYSRQTLSTKAEIARLTNENVDVRASFDALREENANLMNSARHFQDSLLHTLSLAGLDKNESVAKSGKTGDFASFFSMAENSRDASSEISDAKALTSYLENAVQPIDQLGALLKAQGIVFSDIPSVWPLKGGVGHISFRYGRAIHPITGQWYIHRGIDFSTYRSGDPIVSTADGEVVAIGYDSSFGKYVIVKHKHGIYTRYAHMSASYVRKGQKVSQGDMLGAIGNTGVSTGPHLHYEIHVGSEIVDPAKYIAVLNAKKDK